MIGRREERRNKNLKLEGEKGKKGGRGNTLWEKPEGILFEGLL